MTTETPYTVADLRVWANEFRELADTHGLMQPTDWNRKVVRESRAQAAAFDALADGIEVSLATAKSRRKLRSEVGLFMHRILRGEKPK